MNVIKFRVRRACWVSAWAVLVGQAAFTNAQTVLIDFGSDTSYRGLSVTNPDDNGNHWNSVQPGLLITDLIDIENNDTTIDLGWDTPVATDSYNGPAGPTDETTLETDVIFTDIDAAALGNLGGALEAAFDFAAGYDGNEHFPVRFQLQGLNAAATYNLTFFGSHSFSDDATTVYTVYTDDTYTTPVATTSLLVADPFFEPNRDRIATISGVAPQEDDILYIEFVGSTGNGGYLNDMQIEAVNDTSIPGDYDNDDNVDGDDLTVWRGDFGDTGAGVAADGDNDDDADGNDFLIWQRNLGMQAGTVNVGAVPEPAGLSLLLAGMATLAVARYRSRN